MSVQPDLAQLRAPAQYLCALRGENPNDLVPAPQHALAPVYRVPRWELVAEEMLIAKQASAMFREMLRKEMYK